VLFPNPKSNLENCPRLRGPLDTAANFRTLKG
jgi:hypothetical protein